MELVNMEIEVKERKVIEEGKHEGKIMNVENRTEPYEYTDYSIEMEDNIVLKYGVPTDVTVDEKGNPTTKHARLLKALGLLGNGAKVDPEQAIGMSIKFMTLNKETDKGTFANVVDGSIKKA